MTTTTTERPTYLYRLWDDGGYLLYVGITGNVLARLAAHHDSQPWAWQVSGFTTESYPDRAQALAAEGAVIRAERPRYNRRKGLPAPASWREPDPPDLLDLMRLDRLALSQAFVLAAVTGEPVAYTPGDLEGLRARFLMAEAHAEAWKVAGGEPSARQVDCIPINIGAILPDRTYRRHTHAAQSPKGDDMTDAERDDMPAAVEPDDLAPEDPQPLDFPAAVEPDDDKAEPIPGDAPPGDTYNREQAARILGVSPRRVSQLAADDRLEVVQDKPLRLSAESVHRLREERRSPGRDQRATVPPDPAGDVAGQIERTVSLIVAEHRKAIEAGEHLLAEVTAQRDDYRAEVERLRAEVERERDERLAVEARAVRRRWWQRG